MYAPTSEILKSEAILFTFFPQPVTSVGHIISQILERYRPSERRERFNRICWNASMNSSHPGHWICGSKDPVQSQLSAVDS